jgi:predicted phage gp36 major capsid-like protein
MKQTQKGAILNALLRGKKLTTLEAVADFGTTKLPTRIGEWEKKYKFRCHRENVKFKTRYGTHSDFNVYQMKKSDRIKVIAKIKKSCKR